MRQVECWSLYLNASLKRVVHMGDHYTLQDFLSRLLCGELRVLRLLHEQGK